MFQDHFRKLPILQNSVSIGPRKIEYAVLAVNSLKYPVRLTCQNIRIKHLLRLGITFSSNMISVLLNASQVDKAGISRGLRKSFVFETVYVEFGAWVFR